MKKLPKSVATLLRVAFGALLIIISWLLPNDKTSAAEVARVLLIAAATLTVGGNSVLRGAAKALQGEIFNEDIFFTLTTLIAWFAAGGRLTVFLAAFIWTVGGLMIANAERSFIKSYSHLSKLVPEEVAVRSGGATKKLSADDVEIGAVVDVRPGERVPFDGVIVEGESKMSTLAITGGAGELLVGPGDPVLAGYTNLASTITVESRETIKQSTVARLLERISSASGGSLAETWSRRFSVVLPSVMLISALVSIVMTIFDSSADGSIISVFHISLTLLLLACPTSLSRTIPRLFRAATAAATKFGVLFRDSGSMDALSKVKTVAFEKRGALTEGSYRVVSIESETLPSSALLMIATTAYWELGNKFERFDHSVSRASSQNLADIITALKDSYRQKPDMTPVSAKSYHADGVILTIKRTRIAVGGRDLMFDESVRTGDDSDSRNVLYVAINGKYAGRILFGDAVRDGASEAVYQLARADVRTVMFADGSEREAKDTARALGFDKVYVGYDPAGKMKLIGTPQFAYAGIDDELLMAAGVGIKMTSPGPEVLNASKSEMPHLTVFGGPDKIPESLRLSRRTRDAATMIFAVTFGVKAFVIALALMGFMPFPLAVFAEVAMRYVCSLRKIEPAALNSHNGIT
jgi:Cd2+/Zn2+-exporting ATPase